MDLERDIADFLCTEALIIYSQCFTTIPCVISDLFKRWDIIVADGGINFAIQRSLLYPRTPPRRSSTPTCVLRRSRSL